MDVGYSIGTLHEGFHEMATIPDNVPEIPEVPGFQESAYKGLESMSEPGKLREWYVGRSDRDRLLKSACICVEMGNVMCRCRGAQSSTLNRSWLHTGQA